MVGITGSVGKTSVKDLAAAVRLGVHFPDFLQAEPVVLRVPALAQAEALLELAPEVAAAAFGEQRVLGTQFHARSKEAFLWIAFTVNAQIAGHDTAHYTAFVDQGFLSGEAGINLYAKVLGLLGQPAAQIAQRNNVIAFVVHGFRHKQVRDFVAFFFAGEHIDVITHHRSVQRRTHFLPVGEKLVQGAGLKYGTREEVSADFGTFFNYANADFLAFFSRLLLDTRGGGETGRPCADDDNVKLHEFAFHCCYLLNRLGRIERRFIVVISTWARIIAIMPRHTSVKM